MSSFIRGEGEGTGSVSDVLLSQLLPPKHALSFFLHSIGQKSLSGSLKDEFTIQQLIDEIYRQEESHISETQHPKEDYWTKHLKKEQSKAEEEERYENKRKERRTRAREDKRYL